MDPYQLRTYARQCAAVSLVLMAVVWILEQARREAWNAAEWEVELHERREHSSSEDVPETFDLEDPTEGGGS